MATLKYSRRPSTNVDETGLAAIGSSGRWEIALDETISGTQRWFAQIEGPLVYLYFKVSSPQVIAQAIQFLTERPVSAARRVDSGAEENETLVLGKDKGMALMLVRDKEFSDRYSLVIGTAATSMIRLSLTGQDVADVVESLRQANEDLTEDEDN